MTSPIQYMHGESFVYPVVTTSCSEESVQNSVEFKQAYIALPQPGPTGFASFAAKPQIAKQSPSTWICWKSSRADC